MVKLSRNQKGGITQCHIDIFGDVMLSNITSILSFTVLTV